MKKYIEIHKACNVIGHALMSAEDKDMLCRALERLAITADDVVKDEYMREGADDQ